MPKALTLALAKCATSGLDEADFRKLQFRAVESAKELHESFAAAPALVLPYLDIHGQPLRPRPKWPAFYRIRYLSDAVEQRYSNEPNAGVAAYIPHFVDWVDIARRPAIPITITEGELKAACVARDNVACIGLGGVWNFRAGTAGISFLPELEEIDWVKREVNIAFDADVTSKVEVQHALNALAEELVQRGAIPYIAYIPEAADGGKQGIDDFLVSNPQLQALDILKRRQPLTSVRKLFAFNERFTFVRQTSIILETSTLAKYAVDRFTSTHGNVDYSELVLKGDDVSLRKAEIAQAWIDWPCRASAQEMVYMPGQPFRVGDDVNLWPGWGCVPKAGDVRPFQKLLGHLFTGASAESRKWFERWLAYPLQHPGTKLYTASVLHGIRHGTGKSLIGYTMGRIYGKNFTEIAEKSLQANFNSWAEGKQFILGDDVTGTDKRHDNDVLKKLITQRELRINAKFLPEYVVNDCVNYLFTSNHPDAFFLESDDRRFFIHEVTVGPMVQSFYSDYWQWLTHGGAEALFHYLLHLDLGSFLPTAPALVTSSKELMRADTRSELGEWVHRLRIDPDSVLRANGEVLPAELWTPEQLLLLYDRGGTKRVTPPGVAKEMRRQGFVMCCGGRSVRLADGTRARVFAIRRPEYWAAKDEKAVGEAVNS